MMRGSRPCRRVVCDFRWFIAGLFVLHQRMVVLLLFGLWSAVPWVAAQAAVLTVNVLTDEVDDRCPTTCSLRAALASAQAGDAMQFRVSGTIVVTQDPFVLARNVTITGPGANRLALDGREVSRVLTVNSRVTATISGLSIKNGVTSSLGGGILNFGTLTVTHSTLGDNGANDGGGGLFNESSLTLARSIVADSLSGGNCDGTPITSQGDNISNDGTCVATTPALNDRSETDLRLDPTG